MLALRSLSSALIIGTVLSTSSLAQDLPPISAEIASVDTQVAEVDRTISQYDGGLIRSLAQSRREALLLLRTVLETRLQADSGGIALKVTVPATEPNAARAEELLGQMAAAQQRIAEVERESAKAGGLIQALTLSRLETEKLTLAQLQMAYVQARYGVAFPVSAAMTANERTDGVQNATASTTVNKTTTEAETPGAVPWADPDYPNIDYGIAPFEAAHKEGKAISGWWSIEQQRAAIDDSPMVVAVNYSAYNPQSYSGITALIAQCREGETSVVFVQEDFLMSSIRRNTFDMTYRIDDASAQNTRWNELTSNKGAGLFGSDAEIFLRKLHEGKSFFIRLTDGNGQRHDAQFDLSGIKIAADYVANACGWSTLELSRDDYRAVQTLLNAGGYSTGTPDGVWGSGSKNAMRAYQEANGLPATGAPDRATLQALGLPSAK